MKANVRLGPLTLDLLFPFSWKDEYPSSQAVADELERLLAFADSQGRLQNVPADFLSRLNTIRTNQRDEALNELRVALLLHRDGFAIADWEPLGLNRKKGEYSIRTPEDETVFTELKSRGWESELTGTELKAGRAKQPKGQDGEGRPFANWQNIRECIRSDKTYPKFAPTQRNLLVIADDFFVGLPDSEQQTDIALFSKHSGQGHGSENGYFTSTAYENLGGIAIFAAQPKGAEVEYTFRMYGNPYALPRTKLPQSLLKLGIP